MKLDEKHFDDIHLFCGNAIDFYERWEKPIVIISDGPYGIGGYDGDLVSNIGLAEWYEPHIKKWAESSTPLTTLWFWNTELGWATVHPMLEKYGWSYVSCCIWDKGIGHIAGNTNTKTIRRLPVVTEVCVQYVRKAVFYIEEKQVSMKEWLRYEWKRTGLPFSKTNEACGVVDAATRKYFTKCHLWYMPPADAFEKISNYANTFGNDGGKPYFSVDGKNPITKNEWANLRSKFYCPIGVTNVWHTPQLWNGERLKTNKKSTHYNQKPVELIKRVIDITSDEGDVVWDPFAGTFTTAIASSDLNRICYCAEIRDEVFDIAIKRFENHLYQASECLF